MMRVDEARRMVAAAKQASDPAVAMARVASARDRMATIQRRLFATANTNEPISAVATVVAGDKTANVRAAQTYAKARGMVNRFMEHVYGPDGDATTPDNNVTATGEPVPHGVPAQRVKHRAASSIAKDAKARVRTPKTPRMVRTPRHAKVPKVGRAMQTQMMDAASVAGDASSSGGGNFILLALAGVALYAFAKPKRRGR